MRFVHLTLALTITFSQTAFSRCPRRVVRPNPMMGSFQNIFLPGYNERAMPVRMPNGRLAYEEIKPANIPVMQLQREIDVPNVRVLQPNNAYPQETIYYKNPEVISQVVPNIPLVPNMPVTAAAPIMPMAPMPAPVEPMAPLPMSLPPAQPEIVYPYPAVQEKSNCPCSACAAPAPLISPFLPAASPISAWAPPTSNLLPPVIPGQSRTQFLRKVPIPPPTL